MPRATYANDPTERPIQYGLHRIPFNEGKGGKAVPIAGAHDNGVSNTFAKVSPDNKWIVFVKCRNGQLMRPDSELWIIPVEGGKARRLECNLTVMNSWHTWSPNGRWMAFSSKAETPYTQMYLTHIDTEGNASPAILLPNSTAANRAVNIPEFVNRPYESFQRIDVPAAQWAVHFRRSEYLLQEGRKDEAFEALAKTVEADPQHFKAHNNLAILLFERGKVDQAIEHLRKAVAVFQEDGQIYHNLGLALMAKGLHEEAAKNFRAAVAIVPRHPVFNHNLGNALMLTGQRDEALRCFVQSVTSDPRNAEAQMSLGVALLLKGLRAKAVEPLRQAVRLEPDNWKARYTLGRALMANGALDGAIAEFRAAMRIEPESAAIRKALAQAIRLKSRTGSGGR